jgi:hypothetical protein
MAIEEAIMAPQFRGGVSRWRPSHNVGQSTPGRPGSQCSDAAKPRAGLPAGVPERKASTQAAIRRAREIGRP